MNTENKGSYRAHEITRNTDTIKNTNVRKLTSIALMAIMVAGGLTFAIPGMEPAEAAQINSNPNLKVSAEGQNGDNEIAATNIVQVLIIDDLNNDDGDPQPIVTVDDNTLTLHQFSGAWYAYFASTDIIGTGLVADADNDPGTANTDAENQTAVNLLVRDSAIDINGHDDDGTAITGAADVHLIEDLSSEFDVVYESPNGDQTVSMEYDDPDTSISLDRSNYPRNTGIAITIDDQTMNVDPTSEDSWFLIIGEDPRYVGADDADNVATIADAADDRDAKIARAETARDNAQDNAEADRDDLIERAEDASQALVAEAREARDTARADAKAVIDNPLNLPGDTDYDAAVDVYGDPDSTDEAELKGSAQIAYEVVAGDKDIVTTDDPPVPDTANADYKGSAQVSYERIAGNPDADDGPDGPLITGTAQVTYEEVVGTGDAADLDDDGYEAL